MEYAVVIVLQQRDRVGIGDADAGGYRRELKSTEEETR